MRPAHMRSQVFPQMSSDTRVMEVPGGKLRADGYQSFYGPYGYAVQDVGEPYETRPATTRMLMPHERRERILADRDEAYDKANQFHQDRIRAMRNLPGVPSSFSQGGPEFNPFQPVNINNFSLDDPRIQQFMAGPDNASDETMFLSPAQRERNEEEARRAAIEQMARDAVRQGPFSASYDQDPATMHPDETMFLSPAQRERNEEEARRAAIEQMARDAVRQGPFSASYDQDPATMHPQTRSLFDAQTQNMVDLHEQSRGLPLQTFQSERYVPR